VRVTPAQIEEARFEAKSHDHLLADHLTAALDELERYKKAFHAAHTCSMDECGTACAYL
jgi:hypothetical protein